MSDSLIIDLLKAIIGPLLTVGLAWVVGNEISANWTHRQKRREYSLTVVAEFYRVYGDFFALWKLCNFTFRDSKSDPAHAGIQDLLNSATKLESRMETLLLRIASEVKLEPSEIKSLGLFRQGVQLLRQSIVKRRILGWTSSEHPEYKAFKSLSVAVGKLASRVGEKDAPALEIAQDQMGKITHSDWNKEWQDTIAKKQDGKSADNVALGAVEQDHAA